MLPCSFSIHFIDNDIALHYCFTLLLFVLHPLVIKLYAQHSQGETGGKAKNKTWKNSPSLPAGGYLLIKLLKILAYE